MLTLLTIVTALTSPIEGVWQSEGYGLIAVIDATSLTTYEVTAISCLQSRRTALSRPAERGRPAEFGAPGEMVLQISVEGDGRLRIHFDGAASDIRGRRIERLPARCAEPPRDTPLDNFDIFARTYAEHYILFREKGIDWARVTAAARSRVTAQTTPTELFEILRGMIEPLRDAHTMLMAPALQLQYHGARAGTDSLLRGGLGAFRDVEIPRAFAATDRYVKGPLRSWCEGQVWSGWLDDSTGYLRLLSFSGFADSGGFRAQLANLERALDSTLTPNLRALVIDVRINLGGADPLGLAIASRLATAEYLAYTKQARADPDDPTRWTPGQPSQVVPATGRSFHGPVVLLTSGLTISAGETFTQALMGRRPPVPRVGEATQGVFSDVLGRSLPNGWRFGLPNEVFRDAAGRTFDGPGIPPTHPVPVFSVVDREAGRDSALEKALELLRQARSRP